MDKKYCVKAISTSTGAMIQCSFARPWIELEPIYAEYSSVYDHAIVLIVPAQKGDMEP